MNQRAKTRWMEFIMRLRQVETFYWAARLGSFAKAARKLNATHSAISMRIQELEASLGIKLFDRTQRTAKLTSDGIQLLPAAEQMLEAAAEITGFKTSKTSIKGYVRLGVVETIAMTWLAKLVDKLSNEFPGIQMEVEVALSHVLEDKLYAGNLDAILAPCSMSKARFTHTSVGEIAFRWMCSPMIEVPQNISVQDLGEMPLIVTSREQNFRGTLLEWATKYHLRIKRPYICNTFVIAEKLVSAGLGLAFLPLPIYQEKVDDGRLALINVHPEPAPMEHYLIRPALADSVVHQAVESVALAVSSFARGNDLSNDTVQALASSEA